MTLSALCPERGSLPAFAKVMSTPIHEAFARLSMLEFAVEVMLANELAERPEEEAMRFMEEFISRFSSPILPAGPVSSADEQEEAWMAERIQQMATHLMQKVAARAEGMREDGKSQADHDQ